jgi:hypothetical protein
VKHGLSLAFDKQPSSIESDTFDNIFPQGEPRHRIRLTLFTGSSTILIPGENLLSPIVFFQKLHLNWLSLASSPIMNPYL